MMNVPPLQPNILPTNLHTLILEGFSKPNILPGSLHTLEITRMENLLLQSSFPNSLKELHIPLGFTIDRGSSKLTNFLPENTQIIYF